MDMKLSEPIDPYKSALEALVSLHPDPTWSLIDKSLEIVAGLKTWDKTRFGDWEDAVVVLARREGFYARNIYTLLAMVLGITDPKRAAEAGKVISKYRSRSAPKLAKHIKESGGIKKVSHSNHQFPELKVPIRRDRARPISE